MLDFPMNIKTEKDLLIGDLFVIEYFNKLEEEL
jgi:hypothetical protein